jgi:hypothetical protein
VERLRFHQFLDFGKLMKVQPVHQGRGWSPWATQHVGADRVEPKLEERDDTEISAPTPECPEELRVLDGAGTHNFPGCSHDLGGFEITYGHAVLAA